MTSQYLSESGSCPKRTLSRCTDGISMKFAIMATHQRSGSMLLKLDHLFVVN